MAALSTIPRDPLLDLDPWVGQRQASFRFRVTEAATHRVLGEIMPLRSANMSHNTGQTIKRTLQLELGKTDAAAINPVADRISVFMVFPNGAEYPLGRFIFSDSNLKQFTSGFLGSYSLSDEMFLVDQEIRTAINGVGVGIPDVITQVVAGLPVTLHIENSPFLARESWGIGTTRGQILEALSVTGDYFCMAPETLILDTDLRWRSLGDLRQGDEIIGFDENIRGASQRYRRSMVESTNRRVLECFAIDTEFGTTVASADHLWLVRRPIPTNTGHHRDWKRTADLVPGDRIVAFGKPWQEDTSWHGGYLAGFLDREGSLALPGGRGAHTSKIPRVSYGQNPGFILDQVRQLLTDRGFKFRENKNVHGLINAIQQGGKYEAMRLLGSLRPTRLLAKSSFLWEGRATWSISKEHHNDTAVISVKQLGQREVVAIGTSTKTLVADGLLTHNSPWFDNNGILRFIRSFNPADRICDLDFDDGNKVLRESIVYTSDLLNAPNVIIATSNSSGDNSVAVTSVAFVSPNAPNSVARRGFEIPKTYTLQLTDNTQASVVAQGLAQRNTILEKVSLTTAPDPRHDSYNVIKWQNELWLELSWSMALTEGGVMNHQLRKAYLT